MPCALSRVPGSRVELSCKRPVIKGLQAELRSKLWSALMDSMVKTGIVRTIVATASKFAPALAADLAYWLFCKPRAVAGLSEEQRSLANIASTKLASASATRLRYSDGEVQTYLFRAKANIARGKTIILVHGWTGEARYMLGFVDPLLASGFDVVCFDLPAHGKSTGLLTNFQQCAASLQAVANHFPGVYGIVAHSFGAPVTGLALDIARTSPSRFDVCKIALIAAPNTSADIVRKFGVAIGLNLKAQRGFEATLERVCDCSLDDFTGSKYFARINRPMLVLHSKDDREVPYEQGLKYQSLSNCRFVPLNSLGHRDILHAPKVMRAVSKFMSAPL